MTMSLNPVKHKLRYSQVFATEMNQLTFISAELFQINITKSYSNATYFKIYPNQIYLIVVSGSYFSVWKFCLKLAVIVERKTPKLKYAAQNSAFTFNDLSLNFILIEKPSSQ